MPWHPHNHYCWDFWFVWQGQTLHLFYLQAPRLACAYNADRRHNLAAIGHAVLTEFGWLELSVDAPAFAARTGDFWDNLSIWTGSIIEQAGRYYLFYTGRRKEDAWVQSPHQRRRPQQIGIAVSTDLITWNRTATSIERPVIPNPGVNSQFDGMNWHDPYVLKDDSHGKFYAFICAHPKHTEADMGGVVAFAVSQDLENWQEEPYGILYSSDRFYLTEVPQVFWRQTTPGHWRLYLLFSPRWSPFFNQNLPSGNTYYVRSAPIVDRTAVRYSQIPWENEPANLLTDRLYGGKVANPEAEMPVFFGFQMADAGGHFVGGLSDPQRVKFTDDGKMHLNSSQTSPDAADAALTAAL
jgi:beta-fructofuranosidase